MINIVAIGRKHETWIQDGLERYQKRLRAPWNVEWVLLPHSAKDGATARQEESNAILSRLKDEEFVILLDEKGVLLDSPALSRRISDVFPTVKTPVFVIGGAYGVDDKLTARADLVWSLSPLVLPHQLVRLVLLEQLYRAQEIASGGPYHHM